MGAFGGEVIHRGSGGGGAALDRVARFDVLGGVDADEANVVEVAAWKADPERVAVDGIVDCGPYGGGEVDVGGGVRVPRRGAAGCGGGGEDEGDEGEMARHQTGPRMRG